MKKTKTNYKKRNLFAFIGAWVLIVVVLVLCILFCKKETTMCSNVVQEYLEQADFEWQGQSVKKWDNIVVHYIGRLADGTVFDTSVESVAKWCDKYNTSRDYESWLPFTVGAGQMIAWFDRWVENMKIWQTKTIEIPAADAYGEWDETKVMVVEKDKLNLPWQYEEGQTLYAPTWQSVKIIKVTEKDVHLDTNHELAGKDLIFDITIKEIK